MGLGNSNNIQALYRDAKEVVTFSLEYLELAVGWKKMLVVDGEELEVAEGIVETAWLAIDGGRSVNDSWLDVGIIHQ